MKHPRMNILISVLLLLSLSHELRNGGGAPELPIGVPPAYSVRTPVVLRFYAEQAIDWAEVAISVSEDMRGDVCVDATIREDGETLTCNTWAK